MVLIKSLKLQAYWSFMTKKSRCRIKTSLISSACFLFIFALTCHDRTEEKRSKSGKVPTESLQLAQV